MATRVPAQSLESFTEFFGSAATPLEPSADFPAAVAIPDFDSDMGRLLSVELVITATVNGETDIYYLTSQSLPPVQPPAPPPGGPPAPQIPFTFVAVNGAGPGRFIDTVFLSDNAPGSTTGRSGILGSSNAAFESPGGTGLIDLDIDSSGSGTLGTPTPRPGTPSGPAGAINVYGSVEVEYTYATAIPEPPLYAATIGLVALGICVLRRRYPLQAGPGT
jgi:hypothetical protein